MLMKYLAIIVLLLMTHVKQAEAKSSPKFEFGIGTEYGLVGTQIFIPLGLKNIQPYVAFGATALNENTKNNFYASGLGVNFKLNRSHQWGLYGGVLNESSQFEENNGIIESVDSYDYGLSVNYKYRMLKTNWFIGGSYNLYQDGGYPMISFSYRY
jgi:hypothetical protein